MRKLIVASVVSLTVCAAAAAGAPRNERGGWSGTNAYILATTDSDRTYTCKYEMTITYTDGTTHSTKGSTQPQQGATNGRVVTITGSKQVKGVEVDSWKCS